MIAAYVGIIAIAWASTTNATYQTFTNIRDYLMVAFVVFGLLTAVKTSRFNISAGAAFFLFWFYWYGYAAAYYQHHSLIFSPDLFIISATVGVGAVTFMTDVRHLEMKWVLWPLLGFFLSVFVYSAYAGGLIIGFPIVFFFEHAEAGYTLSAAAFYGLSTIVCLAILDTRPRPIVTLPVAAFAGVSFLASLSVGARGEAIAIAAVVLYHLWKRSRKLAILAGSASAALLLYYFDTLYNEDILLISRLQVIIDGQYSMRDQLFFQGIALLADNPFCAAFGCGFTFFQEYYRYDYGLYPHNQFLELVIVYGIFFSAAFLAATFVGLNKIRKMPAGRPLLLMFGFSALIAAKSGTIDSSTLFIPLCFMAIHAAFSANITLREPSATYRAPTTYRRQGRWRNLSG